MVLLKRSSSCRLRLSLARAPQSAKTPWSPPEFFAKLRVCNELLADRASAICAMPLALSLHWASCRVSRAVFFLRPSTRAAAPTSPTWLLERPRCVRAQLPAREAERWRQPSRPMLWLLFRWRACSPQPDSCRDMAMALAPSSPMWFPWRLSSVRLLVIRRARAMPWAPATLIPFPSSRSARSAGQAPPLSALQSARAPGSSSALALRSKRCRELSVGRAAARAVEAPAVRPLPLSSSSVTPLQAGSIASERQLSPVSWMPQPFKLRRSTEASASSPRSAARMMAPSVPMGFSERSRSPPTGNCRKGAAPPLLGGADRSRPLSLCSEACAATASASAWRSFILRRGAGPNSSS
mmetsp:Transcript_26373/g.74212  ORF Transcript_26373/g.74212 Transcript_26373/m.74212 type:complete len:353 (-) Transcript_26373:1227-2285(-)